MTKLVLKDNFYYILAKLFFEIFVGYKSGRKAKIKMLASEGVKVRGGKIVDFQKLFYHF